MPDWQLAAGLTQVTVHDKDGERLLSDTSARQAKLFTSDTLPGDWHTLGGGVSWQSRISPPDDDNPALRQGAVAVYNLMARYRFDTNLSATLNAANLTDKPICRQSGITTAAPPKYHGNTALSVLRVCSKSATQSALLR